MSIVIQKAFYVGSTPTDVTTFTLGVVRNDSGAEVVAPGTAMTHGATGRYSHPLAEPTAGLTYTATFSVVYGGSTIGWSEVLSGSVTESIPLPELTGDYVVDTLNSLLVERLRLSRNGPHPSYLVLGRKMDWGEYLKYLDGRIEALYREAARVSPVEEIGIMF